MDRKPDRVPDAGGMPGRKEHEQTMLSCDFCLKELPASDAICEEGQDYVAHFCGLDCLSAWRERHTHEKRTPSQ